MCACLSGYETKGVQSISGARGRLPTTRFAGRSQSGKPSRKQGCSQLIHLCCQQLVAPRVRIPVQAVNVPKPQPQSTDNAPNQQSDRSPRQLQSDRAARAHRAHREPEPDATGAPDRAAKMRAVQQSAQCANQARSGGKFQKTKHKKAKTATTVQLSTDQAPAELSNSDMTSILQQLDVAYQSVVQTALNQANSEILHSIQSSHLSLPSEREHAVQLWEQARASAAAAIEMINIPTLTQANLNSVANHPPPPKPQKRKRKLVIPTGISSHKSQRRSNQGIGHTKRDSERRIAQMKADTTFAL